jgi:hypothetical protein
MKERTKQNECFTCLYKQSIPGDCHISCRKPGPEMKGNKHGIENGWFFYPINFDPAWKTKECDNFLLKDIKK